MNAFVVVLLVKGFCYSGFSVCLCLFAYLTKAPERDWGEEGIFFSPKRLNSLTESFRRTNPDFGKEHLKSCGCREAFVCIVCV